MNSNDSPHDTTFHQSLQAGMRIPESSERTRPAPAARQGHRTETPPLVLVAEDVPEMRSLLATALRQAGYRARECCDGWDLLNRLKSYILPIPLEEKVDLVVSDIRMPGLTGLEVLEGAHDALTFPPVILITAFGDEETHRRAAENGAAAMIDKPFDLDEFVRIAQSIVPAS